MNDVTRMVDLHTHTNFSDGILSPEELVEEAVWKGLSAIAVTDHDSVGALDAALRTGENRGVEVIKGVELSCHLDGLEVHILGYLMESVDIIENRVKVMRTHRHERMKDMIGKLDALGISVKYDDVCALSGEESIGRPHLARVLVENGHVRNIGEAFSRYLANDGVAYVPKMRLEIAEAIELIKEAKGVSVLAHPGASGLNDMLPLFVEKGIQGIEVYYSAHNKETEEFYLSVARKHNLVVTGGSDYHGDKNNERILGRSAVPYELLQKLKDYQAEAYK